MKKMVTIACTSTKETIEIAVKDQFKLRFCPFCGGETVPNEAVAA